MNRLVVVVGSRAELVNGVTEARSVEFFTGGVSNLRVMALREQGWLESTMTLGVVIVGS